MPVSSTQALVQWHKTNRPPGYLAVTMLANCRKEVAWQKLMVQEKREGREPGRHVLHEQIEVTQPGSRVIQINTVSGGAGHDLGTRLSHSLSPSSFSSSSSSTSLVSSISCSTLREEMMEVLDKISMELGEEEESDEQWEFRKTMELAQ